MATKTIKKTCKPGHNFYKCSDCPTCPACEKLKEPASGFWPYCVTPPGIHCFIMVLTRFKNLRLGFNDIAEPVELQLIEVKKSNSEVMLLIYCRVKVWKAAAVWYRNMSLSKSMHSFFFRSVGAHNFNLCHLNDLNGNLFPDQ